MTSTTPMINVDQHQQLVHVLGSNTIVACIQSKQDRYCYSYLLVYFSHSNSDDNRESMNVL